MQRIALLGALGEVDVVVVVFFGRTDRLNDAPQLFDAKIVRLQIDNEGLTNFEVATSTNLHAGGADLHAVGIHRAREQAKDSRTVKFDTQGAGATDIELTGARHEEGCALGWLDNRVEIRARRGDSQQQLCFVSVSDTSKSPPSLTL